MIPRRLKLAVLLALLLIPPILEAEQGKLVLHVVDPGERPLAHVLISTSGAGGGPKETDDTGRVVILLAPETKANSSVSIQIVKSPVKHDFVLLSPYDAMIRVPSFENDSSTVSNVMVVERNDKAALTSGKALAAFAARINRASAPQSAGSNTATASPQETLAAVSKQYGLPPDDVDKAIRDWGKTVTDPYDAGLAALYERNYPEATKQLTASLEMREKNLKTAEDSVVNSASFLGESLYHQGLYQQAAAALGRALDLRPDDLVLLDATANSLLRAGDYARADPLYRRALAIREKALGLSNPDTASSLNNLAELLEDKGDLVGAEPLLRRALAIDQKALGPDDPNIARDLNNLASLLEDKGDLTGAEPLYRRALTIVEGEKVVGRDNLYIAISLNNLAGLLTKKGDLAGAEPLYRRAIAIDEKVVGPNHPSTATDLNNLASLLQDKGDLAGAEPLYRRALAIKEKALGPDHPSTATSVNNLAELLTAKGDLAGAEPLYRRALAIDEKALGPEHPGTATDLNNLAGLLHAKGDLAGAEPLYHRALAIDEKALGPDHPTTKRVRNNLAKLESEMK